MKFILQPLPILLSLFFCIVVESTSPTAVLDVDGEEIMAFANYYAIPAAGGGDGGLTLAARNSSCPSNVAQEKSKALDGIYLTFMPFTYSNGDILNISQSMDVNVIFGYAKRCNTYTSWMLGSVDAVTGRRYVTAGAILGVPGKETIRNWFKIEKYNDDAYKFVYCPSVCRRCKVVCGDIGVFKERGRRWLGLSDVPFAVKFKKAFP